MKVLAFSVAIVVAILAVAHFAWKYSGSNKWELIQEKNGVRVYSLKVPGATRKQFKAEMQIKTTLNRIVTTMTDTTTEGCREFVPGCVSGAILKPFDTQSLNFVQSYQIVFKRLLSPRQMVIKTQFHQDPRTKTLSVDCSAVPELVHAPPGYVPVTDMHNTWQFTPLGNGMIGVVFVANFDPGLPYWAYNFIAPKGMPTLRRRLERVYNKEKYQHTEFAFIQEH